MVALLIGFVIGFFTSVPTGPINLAVMLKGFSNKTAQGLMIGTGSGFMDIIYCGAAMFGISAIIDNPSVEMIFKIASFAIFLMYGIRTTFFRLHEPKLADAEEPQGLKRHFILGVVLYLSNPSFIAYWITVAGVVQSLHLIEKTDLNNLLFAIGTGFGTVGWFFTLLELVEKQRTKLNKSTLTKITRVFGIVLLLISVAMGYNLAQEFLH